MQTVSSRKNALEIGAIRDFPEKTEISRRYCILSSPRAGGTLLGRMLYQTSLAGDPLEYFNLRLLQLARERFGDPRLSSWDFLRLMEARRTSRNGIFGIKIQFDQMLRAFKTEVPNEAMLQFLNRHQYLFWIRRRDRLRQAISQTIAVHTNVWSSEDANVAASSTISVFDCIRSLQTIAYQDTGWQALIGKLALRPVVIWYEDLAAEYEKTCSKVLSCLGLGDLIEVVPPPPIERQSGTVNNRLYDELVEYLAYPPHLRKPA